MVVWLRLRQLSELFQCVLEVLQCKAYRLAPCDPLCRDSNFQFVGNTSTEAPPVDGVAHALLWRLEMERVLSSYDADNFRVLLQVRLEKRLSQFWTL